LTKLKTWLKLLIKIYYQLPGKSLYLAPKELKTLTPMKEKADLADYSRIFGTTSKEL